MVICSQFGFRASFLLIIHMVLGHSWAITCSEPIGWLDLVYIHSCKADFLQPNFSASLWKTATWGCRGQLGREQSREWSPYVHTLYLWLPWKQHLLGTNGKGGTGFWSCKKKNLSAIQLHMEKLKVVYEKVWIQITDQRAHFQRAELHRLFCYYGLTQPAAKHPSSFSLTPLLYEVETK